MTAQAAIGLGSNLGDREGSLREAIVRLSSLGHLIRTSSLYETAPVGGPEQGWYLNAVAILITQLEPFALLQGLQAIEALGGRTREVHWGPRTLDLDLIVYDHLTVQTPELTLPHPRAHQRAFVLLPLAEVWPDADLGLGTAADLASRIPAGDVVLVARNWAS